MPDMPVPDRGDPAEQDAHAALLKAAADLRELHEKFRGLLATPMVLGEIVRTHEFCKSGQHEFQLLRLRRERNK